MIRLVLASGNRHKVGEFQELARDTAGRIEIVGAEAVGGMPGVAEDAGTFVGNARLKAGALFARAAGGNINPSLTFAGASGAFVLADDSGLCVDALGGGPGVESAYYAGPKGDAAANLAKLVEVMRGVPREKRGAHFTCVLLVLGPGGAEWVFEGRCEGRLRDEPRGGSGFGYDPLFVPEGYEASFAELGPEIKNHLSHRGRAWRKLVEWAR